MHLWPTMQRQLVIIFTNKMILGQTFWSVLVHRDVVSQIFSKRACCPICIFGRSCSTCLSVKLLKTLKFLISSASTEFIWTEGGLLKHGSPLLLSPSLWIREEWDWLDGLDEPKGGTTGLPLPVGVKIGGVDAPIEYKQVSVLDHQGQNSAQLKTQKKLLDNTK